MSDRIEKAEKALADACAKFDADETVTAQDRVAVLLRIAEVQAQISQAESLDRMQNLADRVAFIQLGIEFG